MSVAWLVAASVIAGCDTGSEPATEISAPEPIPTEDATETPDSDDEPQPVVTVFADLLEDETTVAEVDVERYLGKWYEIATFEIVFQTGCTGSTATYSANEDGTIAVKNECFLESLDGDHRVDEAIAEFAEGEAPSKLVVTFPGGPPAPYWIIELDGQGGDEPYEWAVVGSSLPIFLWILSRTPQMPQERLEVITTRLEERGYDLSLLSFTEQPEM